MSELRINFINWRPDAEDTEHDGLSVADNVVHDTEGYKATYLMSAGSFATTGGLAASAATVQSLVAKPVGSQDDLFCAWMANQTLHVGINGVTAASDTTGYPLSFSTAASSGEVIYAFDVTEYAGKIAFVVEARQEEIVQTINSLKYYGYMDF